MKDDFYTFFWPGEVSDRKSAIIAIAAGAFMAPYQLITLKVATEQQVNLRASISDLETDSLSSGFRIRALHNACL